MQLHAPDTPLQDGIFLTCIMHTYIHMPKYTDFHTDMNHSLIKV